MLGLSPKPWVREQSIQLQVEYRRNTDASTDHFYELMTEFGDFKFMAPFGLLMTFLLEKKHAFVLHTIANFIVVVQTSSKMLIKDPRPFYLVDTIIPANCKNFEFGSPSGHALISSAVLPGALKLLFKQHKV